MKGGAKEEHKRKKDERMRKLMKKWAKNHVTWRMGYSKMNGEEPLVDMHTLKIRPTVKEQKHCESTIDVEEQKCTEGTTTAK